MISTTSIYRFSQFRHVVAADCHKKMFGSWFWNSLFWLFWLLFCLQGIHFLYVLPNLRTPIYFAVANFKKDCKLSLFLRVSECWLHVLSCFRWIFWIVEQGSQHPADQYVSTWTFASLQSHFPFYRQPKWQWKWRCLEFGFVLSLRGLWQADFQPRWIWLSDIGPRQGFATMPSHSIISAWWTLPLELAFNSGVEILTSTSAFAPIHDWNDLELVFDGI